MAELVSVPLKKPSDVDIIKPLKNLIQSTYSESNEDFSEAINELSRLRNNAIWKVSELDAIYRYFHCMSHIHRYSALNKVNDIIMNIFFLLIYFTI